MSQEQAMDLTVMPDDVQELKRVIIEFSDYHTAVMNGQFEGKASKVVDKLLDHVKDVYTQTLAQYNSHPWVIAERASREEAQA